MRVGHGVVAPVGSDHRDRVFLAEADDEVAAAGPVDAAASEQERAVRVTQEPRRLADGVRVRHQRVRGPVARGRKRRRRREGVVEDVAGDLDQHRTAPAAHRGAQRGAEELRDAVGLSDLNRPLGHRAEHADQVELLEGILLIVLDRDATHEDNHGGMRDVRRRHSGEEIRRARAAGDQAHARQASHPRETVGHESRSLLVTHVDVLHAAIVIERVQHVQERGAHDSEDVAHLLGLQHLDHRPSARHLTHARCTSRSLLRICRR